MIRAAVLLALMTLASSVLAHGDADWIRRDGYKSSIGELCCGQRDCVELSLSDVVITRNGFRIIRNGEIIPFSEAIPSPTGTYWRCEWGGVRKCFFAPKQGS